MISPMLIIIGCLWLLVAIIEYSEFCYIWQLKEYRLDRFRDFTSTKQGHQFFLRFPLLWRIALFGIVAFWPINQEELFVPYFALVLLTLDSLYYIYRILARGFTRPKLTSKVILIFLLSFAFEAAVVVSLQEWNLLFIFSLIRFFVTSAFVMIISFPTSIVKRRIIAKATQKMTHYPNLKIVGITGSYGKSSVKEFTAHLLSLKYNVIKTPRNINSEIGVAQFILKTDFSQADIFVVEMGAYTKGEIQLICNIVKPQVGVLTAIAEQHLSLFGSIKNIQSAKYELLRSIPKNGFIVTNADNPYCTELLGELECQNIETFGMDEENHPDCLITDIKSSAKGTQFAGTYKGGAGKVMTPVIGAHHAYNIAAAVMVAMHLGVEGGNITHGCETLPTDIHGSLQVYKYGKATIIDDSYNSNPAGFKSALELMSSFSSDKKRVVITRGMLELGEKSEELHERIGEEIAFVADELIVITPDFYDSIKRGVVDKYHLNVILQTKADELVKYVETVKEENCVVLLENRIPPKVYSEISSHASKF